MGETGIEKDGQKRVKVTFESKKEKSTPKDSGIPSTALFIRVPFL